MKQTYKIEEVTSLYFPLRTNMKRIMQAPKVKVKKLIQCVKCKFIGMKRGGRKNCPACLLPYE